MNSQRKKVLIITYNWPPSGGIALLRCLKFAKYLRNFGWEPVIYTASNAHYPYTDDNNFKDIPEGITILKQPILEPFALFKKLSGRKKDEALNNVVHVRTHKSFIDNFAIWVRGNFFIPDARSLWVKPSVKYLSKWLKENQVDAILSDGPPHTNTLIACKLALKTGLPWLADFQDPWTQVDYYPLLKIGKRADRKHHKLEQLCFKTANKTTIASPSWKKDLEGIGAHNVDVIYYGYDEDDFKNLEFEKSPKFTISHAGLLGFDRHPENFLKSIQKVLNDGEIEKSEIEIVLAGQVDFSVLETIKALDLEEIVTLPGHISRMDALRLMVRSHLLLLPLNKAANANGRLPGKLYEYLRARAQILVLGSIHSDAAGIIHRTQGGITVDYDDYKSTLTYVKNLISKWKSGEDLCTSGDIEEFTNENQTGLIAEYLDGMAL